MCPNMSIYLSDKSLLFTEQAPTICRGLAFSVLIELIVQQDSQGKGREKEDGWRGKEHPKQRNQQGQSPGDLKEHGRVITSL